ncbi:hypothetical protein E4U22_003022, partial [Claviceps purpurea]
MVHPSYQLNPGDMFQVDIDKVMYSTGQQKSSDANKRLSENLEARKKRAEALYKAALGKSTASTDGEKATTDGESAAADGETAT